MVDFSDAHLKKDPARIAAARVNAQNYLIRPSMHKVQGLSSFGYTNYLSGYVDAWTRHHHHNDEMEVEVMLKGSQIFEVQGKQYTLRGNQFIILPPHTEHCAKENPHMCRFIYFLLDTTTAAPILSLDAEHSRQLVTSLREMPLVIRTSTPTINCLIVSAFENLLTSSQLCWSVAQAQLAAILYIMLQQYLICPAPPMDAPFTEKVICYIESNITQRITLEEMAKALAYSPTYLKKHFVQIFGMTPHYYITKKKVDAAAKLLQEGSSVTDTAMKLSFSSSAHFSTIFKRYMLVSPTEYCAALKAD